MKNRLMVITDLGHFKVYRMEENEMPRSMRLRLLDEYRPPSRHAKMSELLTDNQGQFGKGSKSFAAVNDMENGERHNIDLEQTRRTIKELASRIKEQVQQLTVDEIYFAADHEINRALLGELDPEVRNKITKNVQANLTKLEQKELLNRF